MTKEKKPANPDGTMWGDGVCTVCGATDFLDFLEIKGHPRAGRRAVADARGGGSRSARRHPAEPVPELQLCRQPDLRAGPVEIHRLQRIGRTLAALPGFHQGSRFRIDRAIRRAEQDGARYRVRQRLLPQDHLRPGRQSRRGFRSELHRRGRRVERHPVLPGLLLREVQRIPGQPRLLPPGHRSPGESKGVLEDGEARHWRPIRHRCVLRSSQPGAPAPEVRAVADRLRARLVVLRGVVPTVL